MGNNLESGKSEKLAQEQSGLLQQMMKTAIGIIREENITVENIDYVTRLALRAHSANSEEYDKFYFPQLKKGLRSYFNYQKKKKSIQKTPLKEAILQRNIDEAKEFQDYEEGKESAGQTYEESGLE